MTMARNPLLALLLALGLMLSSWGCGKPQETGPATVLYVNGHILTMEEAVPEVEALAVGEDGLIEAVGTGAGLKAEYPQAEVVDLDGKTVMPGIIESHGHLLSLGQSFLELSLEGVASPDEAVALVAERVENTPPAEWITGWGWDEGAWARAYPDNAALSRVSPDNPVYLRGLHGFAGWANQKALELAGIDAQTQAPPNGAILKDPESGDPTGILTNEAQELLTRHIPPLSQAQVEQALRMAVQECSRFGITSIHEARTTRVMLDGLAALKDREELKARIYVMLDWTEPDLLEHYYTRGPELDPRHFLTVRCIKVFVDGALGSRGAAMLEPYSDAPDETGLVVTPLERLRVLTERALQTGFQVAVHAIGDRANRITLDAFEQALAAVPDAGDHRLRVEHAQIVSPQDIPRFALSDLVLSMQPPHCTSDMPWVEERVGPERVRGAYAWRSLLATGIHLTLNSDFPGETLNPFHGMYAALTRRSPEGEPPGGWYPEQCLSRSEVLRAYTLEAAYSEFSEEIKGKLLPGMLADFIVLSRDIRRIPVQDLLTLQVEVTFLGGKPVYRRTP
jgi:predicted amidohydrolase YtcJ